MNTHRQFKGIYKYCAEMPRRLVETRVLVGFHSTEAYSTSAEHIHGIVLLKGQYAVDKGWGTDAWPMEAENVHGPICDVRGMILLWRGRSFRPLQRLDTIV